MIMKKIKSNKPHIIKLRYDFMYNRPLGYNKFLAHISPFKNLFLREDKRWKRMLPLELDRVKDRLGKKKAIHVNLMGFILKRL